MAHSVLTGRAQSSRRTRMFSRTNTRDARQKFRTLDVIRIAHLLNIEHGDAIVTIVFKRKLNDLTQTLVSKELVPIGQSLLIEFRFSIGFPCGPSVNDRRLRTLITGSHRHAAGQG